MAGRSTRPPRATPPSPTRRSPRYARCWDWGGRGPSRPTPGGTAMPPPRRPLRRGLRIGSAPAFSAGTVRMVPIGLPAAAGDAGVAGALGGLRLAASRLRLFRVLAVFVAGAGSADPVLRL